MEGVGSRLGRASSRYGPVASAPAFSGPVRKWKRQWVSSRPSNNNGRSSSGSNIGGDNGSNQNGGTPASLFLFRWTPLSSDDNTTVDPPKRKLRYAPVVPLEDKKKKAYTEDKTIKMNHSTTSETPDEDDVFEKLNVGDDFVKETQESSEDQLASPGKGLDLDLFSKGYSDNTT